MAIQKVTKNVLNASLQDLANVDSSSLGDSENGYVLAWDNANSQFTFSTESSTLNDVTGRGATTTNLVTVGGIDINGTVLELDRVEATFTGSQSINASLGTIQNLTLSGSVTFADSVANGEAVTFMIAADSAYTITWPTMEWIGGSAPTLDTVNQTVIQVWKSDDSLYGAEAGVVS